MPVRAACARVSTGVLSLATCAVVALIGGSLAQGAGVQAGHATFSIGQPVPLVVFEKAVAPSARSPLSSVPCGGSCYEPAQLRAAFGVVPLLAKGENGKGQTIVLVDCFGSPTIQSDLKIFDAAFNLPAPPSFKVFHLGNVPPFTSNDIGWGMETTLDVEYAHAIAPGANILLVETAANETEGSAGFPQIVAAENYVISNEKALGITGGAVISQSFGATEQTFGPGYKTAIQPYRLAYEQAERAHVTVLAASGDQGVSGCTDATCSTLYKSRVDSWPSSDPLVTSVGGLNFWISYTAPYKQLKPPTVWNDSQYYGGAGGGGDSAVFARPAFQSNVSKVVGARRGTPDVSMSASGTIGGVEIYASLPGAGGWNREGGTSEATPEFAGIIAIADQVAGKGLGFINPALYALEAAGGSNGIVDVTSGDNSYNGVQGYTAVKGYDMASGVGTVNASAFVPALVAEVNKLG